MSVITNNTIQPSSGQALTIKDEGGTASITVATNGEATFAENIKVTANKGINFSAYATSGNPSSNLLTDYEIGSWTPQSSEGSLFNSNTGVYTKIGRFVFISGVFTVSTNTNGTVFTITGLPFTTKSGDEFLGGGMIFESSPTSEFQLRAQSNSTRIQLYKSAARTYANEAGNQFYFQYSYITDS